MPYAVYHNDTLHLLGTLSARECPEPMADGKVFELAATDPVPARVADYAQETTAVFRRVAFRPLILKNARVHTFALFVDCHPDDVKRVRGFKPLSK